MNVTLPENKIEKKFRYIYISIIILCLVSLVGVIFFQLLEGKTVTTIGNLKGKSDVGYETLKEEFDDLFTNKLQKSDEKYDSKKKDATKEIIYTGYKDKGDADDVNSNLDVNIPYINIKSEKVEEINEEIQETFKGKVDDIKKSKNKNSVYSVVYSGYIQDGILSLIIRANLKEGTKAQRVIVQTYNYNIDEEKIAKFQDILKLENVEKSHAQEKIDEEIKAKHKYAEDLKAMGQQIYERNLDDSMYKVDNVEQFYLHDGSIYIIFSYGIKKYTTEVDVAII